MSKVNEDKKGLPRFWLFVLLILGALVLGDLNQRMADARDLEGDTERLRVKLKALDEDNARLIEEIAAANSEAFVEEWAHNDARMVQEGEVLVVLIGPDGGEVLSGPPTEPDESNLENKEIWIELLVGP